MEHWGLLPPLRKPTIGPLTWAKSIHSSAALPTSLKSVLISSSHLHLGLPKGLFPSSFPTKILYAFLDCSIRATCPAQLSHLYSRFLIILGEEYNACSAALCNFLHSPIISSLLAPNILFLSSLLSRTALTYGPLSGERLSVTFIGYNTTLI